MEYTSQNSILTHYEKIFRNMYGSRAGIDGV